MRSSRLLVLAAALAVAIATQGCKRDYKAPEPKAGPGDAASLVAR